MWFTLNYKVPQQQHAYYTPVVKKVTIRIYTAVCQNLVPLVNIKIAGKWMFIPLKMVLIGIDPYPHMFWEPIYSQWWYSIAMLRIKKGPHLAHVHPIVYKIMFPVWAVIKKTGWSLSGGMLSDKYWELSQIVHFYYIIPITFSKIYIIYPIYYPIHVYIYIYVYLSLSWFLHNPMC